MPQLPQQIDGPQGPVWTAVGQSLANQKSKAAALASQAQQMGVQDRWGNMVLLEASNLQQVVTIGASFQQAGVQVSTGLANGQAGSAWQANLATGTITLAEGSTSATLDSTASGVFAVGMTIGAVVTDATTGVTTSLLTPLTTITAVSGGTLTLSKAAAGSGSGVYAAACNFVVVEPGSWVPLTGFANGFAAASGAYTPAARLVSGDTVQLRGTLVNSAGGNWASASVAELPAACAPMSDVMIGETWEVSAGSSALLITGSLSAGAKIGLDGLAYTLF